jgi:DNA-binding NarL/FixJ family response regulator
MTTRIVIVDDHPVFRRGVRAMLEGNTDLVVVGEAGTGAEAIRLVSDTRPDVVIMDLILPDMSGLQATEQIRADVPEAHVLVLTSHAESDALVPALKAGAIGYVLKSETRLELVNAVRAVMEGKPLVPPEFTAQLVNAVAGHDKADPLDRLTARELDVLRLLGRGLSNVQIASRLAIGEGTVKTHVSSLFSKLNMSDRTQAALYAVKRALVKPDEIEL